MREEEKEEGRTRSPALAYRDRLGLQREEEEEGGTLGDPLQAARRWMQKERRSQAKASGAAWKSKAAGGGEREREDGRVPVGRSDNGREAESLALHRAEPQGSRVLGGGVDRSREATAAAAAIATTAAAAEATKAGWSQRGRDAVRR